MIPDGKLKWVFVIAVWLLAAAQTHAFYNPNTGRWLDRDPLLDAAFQGIVSRTDVAKSGGTGWEAETLQLEYVFVGNVTPSRIDMLGLCGPGSGPSGNTCGKDVTRAMKLTQVNVRTRYGYLSYWKKKANCQPWSGIWPTHSSIGLYILYERAFSGWDIGQIGPNWEIACKDGACGRGRQCEGSVYLSAQSSGCYYGWDVNYALFGWINDLCGFSESHMESLVWAYKNLIKRPWGDKGDAEQAMGFAKAGYAGWPLFDFPTIPSPRADFTACQNCGRSYRDEPLNSTWPNSAWKYVWY
jgi:hypothetical protein